MSDDIDDIFKRQRWALCSKRHAESSEYFWPNDKPEGGTFWVHVTNRGTRQVGWTCEECGYERRILRHRVVQSWGIDIESLPIRSTTTRAVPGYCEVLGCPDEEPWMNEYHHFAPRSIFGYDMADAWPGAYVCQRHHREWHRKMQGRQDSA